MASELDAVITALGCLPEDATAASDAELATRMRQLVQLRAMVDAALVTQLSSFDARASARYDGQTSTVAWLRSRLRLGGQAAHLLQVARHLADLPEIAKAFTAGDITLEHASEIARLSGQVGADRLADYESILLDLARRTTPATLRAACQHIRQLLDPDGDATEAVRQHQQRYLSAARTVGGMVHLQGLLDPPSGDVVLTALQAAMPAPADHEERTAAQRRADGLVDICAGWMAAGAAPTSGGIRPQVQVTVSLRSLQSSQSLCSSQDSQTSQDSRSPQDLQSSQDSQSPHGSPRNPHSSHDPQGGRGPLGQRHDPASQQPTRCDNPPWDIHADVNGGAPGEVRGGPPGAMWGDVPVLTDRKPISLHQARRIACDAGVIPVVLGGDSELLDIGRQSRVVPVGLRRALNLRDGGCRFAGCDRPPSWTDAHHIHHWADGGSTDADNCVLLCAHHHTLVHEGWRLKGNPHHTLSFERPDGTRLDLTSAPRGRPLTRGP